MTTGLYTYTYTYMSRWRPWLIILLLSQSLHLIVVVYSFTTTPLRSSAPPHQHHQHHATRVLQSSPTDDTDVVSYDCIVIGAGVVGAVAALTAAAAAANRTVALVGCPPASSVHPSTGADLSLGGPTGLFSKALRDTSKQIKVTTLRGMGLREESVWNEIISSCCDLASSNANDMERQLNMAGVDYIPGIAAFTSATTLDVKLKKGGEKEAKGTRSIRGDKILIATGSRPFRPQGIPFDGERVFDSDSINTLTYLPKSIAITGSGIIAVEFAKIFRNLGAEVTLIIRDFVPRNALMKIGLDIDVAATLVADLVRSGIKIERGAQACDFIVPPISTSNNNNNALRQPIQVTLQGRGGTERPSGATTQVKCDAYLAAVGREPLTEALDLDQAGIETDEYGGIVVDSTLRTTASNIWAAGDVVGRPFLASTGVAQAQAAVQAMWGSSTDTSGLCDADDPLCVADGASQAGLSFDPTSLAANPLAFPTGIWSSPEAAYYGFTKQQALERGTVAGEGIALYAECLRGRVFSPNGLLKLVYAKDTGRILGVHICGQDACELIHYGMELVKGQRTIQELSQAMFSAVTFHEMYKIAAQAGLDEKAARQRRAAAGRALAQRNRRAIDS